MEPAWDKVPALDPPQIRRFHRGVEIACRHHATIRRF